MSIVFHFGLNFLLAFIFLVMLNFSLRKLDDSQSYLVLSDYMNILLQAIICSFVSSMGDAVFNLLLFIFALTLYIMQISNIICKHRYGFKISLHRCKVPATNPSQKHVLLLLIQNTNLFFTTVFTIVGFMLFFFCPVLWFQYFLIIMLVFTLHMLTGGDWRLNRIVSWLVLLVPLFILTHRYVLPGLQQFPVDVFNRIGSAVITILIALYIWHFFSKTHFFSAASLLREQFREEANKNHS